MNCCLDWSPKLRTCNSILSSLQLQRAHTRPIACSRTWFIFQDVRVAGFSLKCPKLKMARQTILLTKIKGRAVTLLSVVLLPPQKQQPVCRAYNAARRQTLLAQFLACFSIELWLLKNKYQQNSSQMLTWEGQPPGHLPNTTPHQNSRVSLLIKMRRLNKKRSSCDHHHRLQTLQGPSPPNLLPIRPRKWSTVSQDHRPASVIGALCR